jgi:hypothetical protein
VLRAAPRLPPFNSGPGFRSRSISRAPRPGASLDRALLFAGLGPQGVTIAPPERRPSIPAKETAGKAARAAFYAAIRCPLVTSAASSVRPVTPEIVAIWTKLLPPPSESILRVLSESFVVISTQSVMAWVTGS